MSGYEAELQVAADAVRQAAVLCQSVQRGISADALQKKDNSPVTIADFGSQALICRALQSRFPDDAIIAEEESSELRGTAANPFREQILSELRKLGLGPTNEELCDWIDRGKASQYSGRFWTIDPIDGTKGFLRGEQYAISLALIVNGQIVVAALGCPNLPTEAGGTNGSLYLAVRGGGSRVLPIDNLDLAARRVQVSTAASGAEARLCESVEAQHSAHDASAEVARTLGIRHEPVRLDSQAKYATVADARADIYLRLPTRKGYVERIWDHAGGVLVVEEAGGKVSDIDGKPLEFTHGRGLDANRGVVVSNGILHDAVIAAIRAVGV